jgi:hypothetical protein
MKEYFYIITIQMLSYINTFQGILYSEDNEESRFNYLLEYCLKQLPIQKHAVLFYYIKENENV